MWWTDRQVGGQTSVDRGRVKRTSDVGKYLLYQHYTHERCSQSTRYWRHCQLCSAVGFLKCRMKLQLTQTDFTSASRENIGSKHFLIWKLRVIFLYDIGHRLNKQAGARPCGRCDMRLSISTDEMYSTTCVEWTDDQFGLSLTQIDPLLTKMCAKNDFYIFIPSDL